MSEARSDRIWQRAIDRVDRIDSEAEEQSWSNLSSVQQLGYRRQAFVSGFWYAVAVMNRAKQQSTVGDVQAAKVQE